MLITPGNPTKFKKTVYLSASVVLGVMLSFLAHAIIEMIYLRLASSQDWPVSFHYGCALPLVLSYGLFIIGIIGGYFLGRYWWRWIYIDRVWEIRSKK